MRHRLNLLLALTLAAVFLATPVMAEIYTVKLFGGPIFLTKYPPQEASWDSEQVIFLSENGNWLAMPKGEIESVVADTESRGFGKVINSTTIEIGFTANDAPDPEAEGASEEAAFTALKDFLTGGSSGDQQSYDQKQFVDPSQVGGGIPVNYASDPNAAPGSTGFGPSGSVSAESSLTRSGPPGE